MEFLLIRIGLAKTMAVGNANGVIEDIYVTDIPNTVSVGGSLRVGSEIVRVLNVYNQRKVIRVQRNEGRGNWYCSYFRIKY